MIVMGGVHVDIALLVKLMKFIEDLHCWFVLC